MGSKTVKLKPSEFVLLILYAYDCSSIKGNTRFQKIAFIFENEIYKQKHFDKLSTTPKAPSLFDFHAYKFGPFSKPLLKHIDFFVRFGMVEKVAINTIDKDFYLDSSAMESNDDESGITYYEYSITNTGKEYVENKLVMNITDEQKDALKNFKKQFIEWELKSILNYVYTKYEKFTENSEILEEVLNYDK